jgi:hypothetical protein
MFLHPQRLVVYTPYTPSQEHEEQGIMRVITTIFGEEGDIIHKTTQFSNNVNE